MRCDAQPQVSWGRRGSITKCYLHKLTGLLPILMLEIYFRVSVYLCSLQTTLVLTPAPSTLHSIWLVFKRYAQSKNHLNIDWSKCATYFEPGLPTVWCRSVAVSHNPDTIVTGGGSAQPALGEINAHVTRYNTQHRVHTNIQTYSHNEYLSVRALAAGRPALVWEDGGAGRGRGRGH